MKPLEPALWPKLEAFFRAEKCSGCWCMNHRLSPGTSLEGEPALAAGVANRTVLGVLAFDGEQAVGWCAFDRMADLPGLDCGYPVASEQRHDIWSIHCLSALTRYPKDALVEAMIAASLTEMTRLGAKRVEGYPPPTAPSDNSFSGTIEIFQRLGFHQSERVTPFYTRMVKII